MGSQFAGAAEANFQYWIALLHVGGSMRYISRGSAIGLALLVLAVSVAPAQHPQTRKGFWIGFGLGWGSYGISCSSCSGVGRTGSNTGYLKMGGTVSPHLLLGGESVVWVRGVADTTLTVGNVTFSAYYYPQPASGLFLNAGVGFSRAEVSDGGTISSTGPGLTLGAGYDIRVGTNLSITPTGQWVYGHPDRSFSQNFFHFALGVTFH